MLKACISASRETTPDVHVLSLNGSNPEVLPKFVETAHKNVCILFATCYSASYVLFLGRQSTSFPRWLDRLSLLLDCRW